MGFVAYHRRDGRRIIFRYPGHSIPVFYSEELARQIAEELITADYLDRQLLEFEFCVETLYYPMSSYLLPIGFTDDQVQRGTGEAS